MFQIQHPKKVEKNPGPWIGRAQVEWADPVGLWARPAPQQPCREADSAALALSPIWSLPLMVSRHAHWCSW